MKNLFKSITSVAIVAMAFAGCSKEATDVTAPITKKGVTVRFNAEVIDETRATLAPNDDETTFTAAWEDNDQIGFHIDRKDESDEIINSYDDVLGVRKNGYFEAQFDTKPANAYYWSYYAYYPYSADNTYGSCQALVPFGRERIQYGNEYNSAYDIMVSSGIDASKLDEGTTVEIGVDENGDAIVMPMKRMTAIAYFHFTTTAEAKTDKVLSVTLSATPNKTNEPLAADKAYVHYGEKKYQSVTNGGTPVNTIKITYDSATAPTAADFKAWFNVLPGIFSDVKLVIETENYTAAIARTGEVIYEAGKLAKVAGNISDSKWTKKSGGESGGEETSGYRLVTDASTLAAGDKFIIACNSIDEPKAAGAMGNGKFLTAVDVEISADKQTLTPNDNIIIFTLGGQKDAWTLTTSEGQITANAAKTLILNTGNNKTWTITIDKNANATIAINSTGSTDLGNIEYNVGSPRFLNYASGQTAVQIYKIFEAVMTASDITGVPARGVTNREKTAAYEIKNFKNNNDDVVVESVSGCVAAAQKSANGTITYTVNPNYTGAETTGTIKLVSAANNVSATINVKQVADVFSAARTEVELDAKIDDAQTTVSITSDFDWTIDTSALTGATVTPTSFTYDATATNPKKETITIKATDANTTEDAKNLGSFIIKRTADSKEIKVTVTQKSEIITISNPTNIIISEITESSFKASWTAAENAESYDWEIRNGDMVVKSGDTTGTTLDITDGAFAVNTEYVLYVKAKTTKTGYKSQTEFAKSDAFQYGATEVYTLVTDASTLAAGDKVIIVAATKDYAMSTTQNNNNRGQATIKKSNNKIDLTDVADVQVFTLEAGTKSGTFAFNTGNGYIYAASSKSNNLKTEESLSDNSSWIITIASNNATITAQGTYTRNIIKYNSSNSLFSCYNSGQLAVQIYKK